MWATSSASGPGRPAPTALRHGWQRRCAALLAGLHKLLPSAAGRPSIPVPSQAIQFLGEDGTVANITAGPFRTCAGGAAYVIDAPLT